MATTPDRWMHGALYDRYVGRWSRPVAEELLAWMAAPPGLDWLDVGCGTGALAGTIAARCAPRRLAGVDPSAGFLAVAREHLGAAAELQPGDAQALPFGDGSFDRVVSGLVLNFVPDPARAASEMARVLRPSGVVAVYVWDYAERMEMMRRFWDAAVALDPAGAEVDESRRFPICQPDALRRLFEGCAALRTVETRAIEVPTIFRDFDDFWQPFAAGQGPAPAYCAALPEERRAALRERLRASLPARADGSIHLVARAFAVRGERASSRHADPQRDGVAMGVG